MSRPDGTALPRLLLGVGQRRMTDLDEHTAVHGSLPDLRKVAPEQIIAEVERAGLLGHGGAAFPTARKLRAVAARRRPRVLVANGTEGEPASEKDRTLMREAPHLVLDGAALAARAIKTSEAVLAVSESDPRGAAALSRAIEDRRRRGWTHGEPEWRLVRTPERYIAGQESALVNWVGGGAGLPTFGPRPFERGVRGRPTLVQNVETLAHMALIVRHGASWFRQLGTTAQPGSALLSVSGGVPAPGVYEVAHGMPLDGLLGWLRAPSPGAILIGGYFGTWLRAEEIPGLRLSGDSLRRRGAGLGAGVIVVVPREACPVAETTRVAEFFATESAGQCGPCVHGLAAVARTVAAIGSGAAAHTDLARLQVWVTELRGRGACQHPDGAARFMASALTAFADEFDDHLRHGPCQRCQHPPVLPLTPPQPAVLAA